MSLPLTTATEAPATLPALIGASTIASIAVAMPCLAGNVDAADQHTESCEANETSSHHLLHSIVAVRNALVIPGLPASSHEKCDKTRDQNVNVCEYLTMSARESDSGSAGRSNRDGARSVSSPSL